MHDMLLDNQQKILNDGFAIIEDCLDTEKLSSLIKILNKLKQSSSAVRRRGDVYAMRNLLHDSDEIRAFCKKPELLTILNPILGPDVIPVRAIFFNKPFRANWNVIWHQDLTIALRARFESPGFCNWTRKSGVLHAQAPAAVLEQMLTLRIHLDRIDASNGALRVIPGSHRYGIIGADSIQQLVSSSQSQLCSSSAGAIMAMRPLLLHSSKSSSSQTQERRILHIEYAGADLPTPLEWAFA